MSFIHSSVLMTEACRHSGVRDKRSQVSRQCRGAASIVAQCSLRQFLGARHPHISMRSHELISSWYENHFARRSMIVNGQGSQLWLKSWQYLHSHTGKKFGRHNQLLADVNQSTWKANAFLASAEPGTRRVGLRSLRMQMSSNRGQSTQHVIPIYSLATRSQGQSETALVRVKHRISNEVFSSIDVVFCKSSYRLCGLNVDHRNANRQGDPEQTHICALMHQAPPGINFFPFTLFHSINRLAKAASPPTAIGRMKAVVTALLYAINTPASCCGATASRM